MKKWISIAVCIMLICGCSRYVPEETAETVTESVYQDEAADGDAEEQESEPQEEAETETEAEIEERDRVKVKGIYVSAYAAGTAGIMNEIIDKIDKTEINAVVIDVKDDEGRITFAVDSPIAGEIEASRVCISDIGELMARLKEHNIYTIARVVAFKDSYLAEKKPEWCIKNADGGVYKDKDGNAWANPYCTEVWDYLTEIGVEAGRAGFDEVQFDYLRFAADRTMGEIVFDNIETQGRSKTDIIMEFIRYTCSKLKETGVFVSADVFGAIIESSEDAQSIGQDYYMMSGYVDYICPMIYPSHYANGNFGVDVPDTMPYEVVCGALNASGRVLSGGEEPEFSTAVVRPWLQDFTASYLKKYIRYGPEQIRAQIQAVYDSGYEEWILWNASCRYTWEGLLEE